MFSVYFTTFFQVKGFDWHTKIDQLGLMEKVYARQPEWNRYLTFSPIGDVKRDTNKSTWCAYSQQQLLTEVLKTREHALDIILANSNLVPFS